MAARRLSSPSAWRGPPPRPTRSSCPKGPSRPVLAKPTERPPHTLFLGPQKTMWETLLRSPSSNPTGFTEALDPRGDVAITSVGVDTGSGEFRVTAFQTLGSHTLSLPE